MTDDDLTTDDRNQDLPEGALQWEPPATEELPERLRVHTLARALRVSPRAPRGRQRRHGGGRGVWRTRS